jgi:hypothetical protein
LNLKTNICETGESDKQWVVRQEDIVQRLLCKQDGIIPHYQIPDKAMVVVAFLVLDNAMHHLLNPDDKWIVLHAAKKQAQLAGIPQADIERTIDLLHKRWEKQRGRNPMVGMF